MLVYDMTSSTSFTRLLKWYSDLIELFAKTAKPIPILIVANKIDLFQSSIVQKALSNRDDVKPETTARPATSQPRRRNVMGFTGEYYGQHFHYEYQICSPEEMEQGVHGPMYQIPTESADHSLTKRSGNKKAMTKRHVEISSYLVNRDNWTTDGSYLDSLLHSEDGSHPDRELVLLWCARNGLQMVEMSAATGEGVNEAIEALVALALHTQHNQLQESQVPPSMTTATPPEVLPTTEQLAGTVEVFPADRTLQARTKASEIALYTLERPNKELDLHQRYAKKDNNCFSLIPSFRHCLK
jgi:GTPase SAR1 family protein